MSSELFWTSVKPIGRGGNFSDTRHLVRLDHVYGNKLKWVKPVCGSKAGRAMYCFERDPKCKRCLKHVE